MTNMRGQNLDKSKAKMTLRSALGKGHKEICLGNNLISNFLIKSSLFNQDSILVLVCILPMDNIPHLDYLSLDSNPFTGTNQCHNNLYPQIILKDQILKHQINKRRNQKLQWELTIKRLPHKENSQLMSKKKSKRQKNQMAQPKSLKI